MRRQWGRRKTWEGRWQQGSAGSKCCNNEDGQSKVSVSESKFDAAVRCDERDGRGSCEDHRGGKFEKRPFAARRPGAHPMGTDNRYKRQKETAMLAGEVPLPKPKPSMHHMQMGAGWKKQLGRVGTGMRFVADAAKAQRWLDKWLGGRKVP